MTTPRRTPRRWCRGSTSWHAEREPTDAVPITYREYSFAVAQGAGPKSWSGSRARPSSSARAILSRASQKFVQIALFDHRSRGDRNDPRLRFGLERLARGASVPVSRIAPPGTPVVAPTSLPAPAVNRRRSRERNLVVVQAAPVVVQAAPVVPSFSGGPYAARASRVQVAPQPDAPSMQPVAAPVAKRPRWPPHRSSKRRRELRLRRAPNLARGKLPSPTGEQPHAAGRAAAPAKI